MIHSIFFMKVDFLNVPPTNLARTTSGARTTG